MQCRRSIDAGRRGFVTQSTFAMLTAGLGLGAGPHAGAAGPLARAAAASPGLDPRGVDSFLDAVAAGSFELHSLVVARHGHIVAGGWYAPYRAQAPHLLSSLSKSFTSTAVGFVAEGKLHLFDKVVDFFPGQVPPTISANLAALNVQHLRTMSVGMRKDATPVVTHSGTAASPRHPAKVAVAGAWKDAQTFEMRRRYYETPHFDIVTIHFIERRIEVSFQNSLTLMSTALHVETRPALKGIASS